MTTETYQVKTIEYRFELTDQDKKMVACSDWTPLSYDQNDTTDKGFASRDIRDDLKQWLTNHRPILALGQTMRVVARKQQTEPALPAGDNMSKNKNWFEVNGRVFITLYTLDGNYSEVHALDKIDKFNLVKKEVTKEDRWRIVAVGDETTLFGCNITPKQFNTELSAWEYLFNKLDSWGSDNQNWLRFEYAKAQEAGRA